MYKNNNGLIARTKVSKFKKGLCLIGKFVFQNSLLFLHKTVVLYYQKPLANDKIL